MAKSPSYRCFDLGEIDYETARQLQEKIVALRVDGSISYDAILLLEHPPVFTMGRRGGRDNLLVGEAFLKEKQISMHHVERGGDITYHGPGQLVVYPIVRLSVIRLGVSDFVERIEEVMIRTAADYDIVATRKGINRGAWVGDKKLGSIGLAVRRGVTFHGMALNVLTDLAPFSWITPCGLKNIVMTNMKNETEKTISMPMVKSSVIKHWETVFKTELAPHLLYDIHGLTASAHDWNKDLIGFR